MSQNAMGTKFCPDCKNVLPLASFTRNRRNRDGYSFYCAPCSRARVVASRRSRLGSPKTRNGQGPKDVPFGSKWCPECGAVKPLAQFPRNRSQSSGYGSYCKPCHNAIGRANREAHGGPRNYHLRRRYGITAEHADALLAEQGGLCAICREAPAAHVDHDHATGRVRGLLCFNCNGALGQFRDRPDLMLRAYAYLTASGHTPLVPLPDWTPSVAVGFDPTDPRPEDDPRVA